MFWLPRETERNLTPSYNKSPFTNIIFKIKWQHKKYNLNFDYTTISDQLKTARRWWLYDGPCQNLFRGSIVFYRIHSIASRDCFSFRNRGRFHMAEHSLPTIFAKFAQAKIAILIWKKCPWNLFVSEIIINRPEYNIPEGSHRDTCSKMSICKVPSYHRFF